MSNKHTTEPLRMKPGEVCHRSELLSRSKSIDRDLKRFVENGQLQKVSGGLYYRPVKTRFGLLPPDNKKLVKAFLSDDRFLMFSHSDYNTLGLGLTQLYDQVIVYNKKRHGVFELGNKKFDFRRPSKGFPRTLTKEFLLVNLVNSRNELAESTKLLKASIEQKLDNFDKKRLKNLVKYYGKVSTTKFFMDLL